MHAVRKYILEILKAQSNGATVAELAERLDMAPVSVRHHLDILQGDNLICVDRLERKGNVGRPQQIYALTEEAVSYFPNNFAALAGKLVEQIKQMLPPDQVPCAFRTMAQEMAAECEGLQAGMSMEAKLEQITEFLNERGYLARWEEVAVDTLAIDIDAKAHKTVGSVDFLLHKYNCPYAGVSSQHSELCLMDQTLINELTGCACERVASLAEGSSCCTYRVDGQRMNRSLETHFETKPTDFRVGERKSTSSDLVLHATLGTRNTNRMEHTIGGVAAIVKSG